MDDYYIVNCLLLTESVLFSFSIDVQMTFRITEKSNENEIKQTEKIINKNTSISSKPSKHLFIELLDNLFF